MDSKRSSFGVDASAAEDDGPVSTTKALLISLIAPRRFSTKSAQPAAETEGGNANSVAAETVETTAATATTTTANEMEEPEQAPPAASSQGPQIEEISESERTDDGLQQLTADKDKEEEKEEEKLEEEEEEEMKVTPELAAAVVVGESPDESLINVEELLRITFLTLLDEGHFLNVPTLSYVIQHPKKSNSNSDDEKPLWIHVQVMARPASLGIILDRFEHIGVGTNCGTVSIFQAELCKTASPYAHMVPADDEEKEEEAASPDGVEALSNNVAAVADATASLTVPTTAAVAPLTTAKELSSEPLPDAADLKEQQEKLKIEAARQEWKNAATRLRIEQVREQIAEQAAFSFDFIALLATASILAGVGLITDNTVVIVASMLVSPIMGPVLGLTFGSRIKDWPLVKTSLKNETLALLGCIIIGVFVGLVGGFTKLAEDTWPTNEMEIRGEPAGLLTGIAVAIPSGMGVCLSILGGNTSSLVGVAISASLLPPAVNAGICFMYSLLLAVGAVDNDNGKTANDFAVIGGISFALTAINIVCIWLSGSVMFEIKEVAPTPKKNAFWARDIKVARELNTKKGEKPPPVNISVLRDGVKTALSKKQKDSDAPIGGVQFEAPPPPARYPFAKQSLGATLALEPRHDRKPSSQMGFFAPLWGLKSDKIVPDQEEEVDENVRYVGLEDMAQLLGFDEDDDDAAAIDHAAVARNIGKGRYL